MSELSSPSSSTLISPTSTASASFGKPWIRICYRYQWKKSKKKPKKMHKNDPTQVQNPILMLKILTESFASYRIKGACQFRIPEKRLWCHLEIATKKMESNIILPEQFA